MGRGSLVGRQSSIDQFAAMVGGTTWENSNDFGRRLYSARNDNTTNFVQVTGGPMRHIIAAADYFVNQAPNVSEAEIRVQLHNAMWLAHFNPNFQPEEIEVTASPTTLRNIGSVAVTTTAQALEALSAAHPGLGPLLDAGLDPDTDGDGDFVSADIMRLLNAYVDGNVAAISVHIGNSPSMIAYIDVRGHNWGWLRIIRTVDYDVDAGTGLVTVSPGSTDHLQPLSTVYVRLPIEYVTHRDANENPVFLTFQHYHGWGQAGTNAMRTDLTVSTPARFIISRADDDLRHFHRYGRVQLPWFPLD
jgi:hypothetical protein